MKLPDTIDAIRPSVVQLIDARDLASNFSVFNPDRSKPGALGSGFVIDCQGTIVTAHHVIDGVPAEQLLVGFAGEEQDGVSASFRFWKAKVIGKDPLHDLAALRLLGTTPVQEVTVAHTTELVVVFRGTSMDHTRHPVSLNSERVRAGTAIAVSGYPLTIPVLTTNAGHMATSRAFDERQISQYGSLNQEPILQHTEVYLADLQANPNNSGGPVYLVEDGTVIGVCKARRMTEVVDQGDGPVTLHDGRILMQDTGLTVVVPARYINELMERCNSPDMADDGADHAG